MRLGFAIARVVGVVALATLVMAVGNARAQSPPEPKNILVFYDFSRLAPAILAHEQGVMSVVRNRTDLPINAQTEYLNLTQQGHDKSWPEETVAYLKEKYALKRLDLIVVSTSQLLRFLLQHREQLAPGVPIIFGAVERHAAADIVLPSDITGIWLSLGWAGTLEAARRLQPDVTHVVVVSGVSAIDRVWANSARAELASVTPPIQVSYLAGMSLDALAQQVSVLPKKTVVLVGAFTRDATGRNFVGAEAIVRLAAASSVPVYTVSDIHVGAGPVGGHVVSWEAQGRRLGELAVKALRGERPPPGDGDTNVYKFDARQLRRFGLDAGRLPQGSTLLFEEPSVWRQYGLYIGGGALLILFQGTLIAALLIERAQRHRAQRELADRLRFETLLSDLSALFASQPNDDVDQRITGALHRIGEALGVDRVTLGEFAKMTNQVLVTHTWTRDGVHALPGVIDGRAMPWVMSQLREGRPVALARPEDLPVDAAHDRRTLVDLGTRSLAVIPVSPSDTGTGYVSVAALREERKDLSDLVARLTLLAEVLVSALARRRADLAMEETRQHREELVHVQRVSTLGELAGALAHEVNQPLAAIAMNAAAATRLLDAPLGEHDAERKELKETLADISADSQRTANVVRGVRALFSKTHDHGPVDVNDVVERVVALLRNEFDRKRIWLSSALDRSLPPVLGDAVQLQQVVLNLLMNASDAVLQGGRREVAVATTRTAPDRCEMMVRDAGVGVDESQLTKMFERFVSGKPGGLGMGLSICRSIVEAHGGRIWATRNPDQGVTLHVELPV